jgi:DNA modification methylase
LRIILSSSKQGDYLLDPFAGSGTTAVVANQIKRNSVSIEIDPLNVDLINSRLEEKRDGDAVSKYLEYYRYTKNLDAIWGITDLKTIKKIKSRQKDLSTFLKS